MRPNAFSLTHPYTWDGPLSRTVKDAAHALQAMARFDPFDPVSLDRGERDFVGGSLDKPLKGWRIGFTPDFGIFPVDPEIKDMVAAAAQLDSWRPERVVEPVEFGIARFAFRACRGMVPPHLHLRDSSLIEALKGGGIDLLRDHADDVPAEFVYWINDAYRRGYVDYNADDVVRTEDAPMRCKRHSKPTTLSSRPSRRAIPFRTFREASRRVRSKSPARRSSRSSAGASPTSAISQAIQQHRFRRASRRTVSLWVCRSSDGAGPTRTCWRQARRSSAYSLGPAATR